MFVGEFFDAWVSVCDFFFHAVCDGIFEDFFYEFWCEVVDFGFDDEGVHCGFVGWVVRRSCFGVGSCRRVFEEDF